jgi:hypothetical protein
MVVIGIMGLITGMFLVSFNSLQGPRNLKIAQNQLITDIRRIQSYTLSSRDVVTSGSLVPASYYVIRFDASSNSYIIQSIDKKDFFNANLQTINLPKTVQISALKVFTSAGVLQATPACVQVAFSLPYGRVLMDYSACAISTTIKNSADLSANKNLILDIYLSDPSMPASTQKIIEINGISQGILVK